MERLERRATCGTRLSLFMCTAFFFSLPLSFVFFFCSLDGIADIRQVQQTV